MNFELNDQEINLVLGGLGKLPAEASFNLLSRLLREVEAENQRRKAPTVQGPQPIVRNVPDVQLPQVPQPPRPKDVPDAKAP